MDVENDPTYLNNQINHGMAGFGSKYIFTNHENEKILLKKSYVKRYLETFGILKNFLYKKFDDDKALDFTMTMGLVDFIVYCSRYGQAPIMEVLISFDRSIYNNRFNDGGGENNSMGMDNDDQVGIEINQMIARRNWMESITRELSFGCHIYRLNVNSPIWHNDPKYLLLLNSPGNTSMIGDVYSIINDDGDVSSFNLEEEIDLDATPRSSVLDNMDRIYFIVRYDIITSIPFDNEACPWLDSSLSGGSTKDIAYILMDSMNISYQPVNEQTILKGKKRQQPTKTTKSGNKKMKANNSSSSSSNIENKDKMDCCFKFFFVHFYKFLSHCSLSNKEKSLSPQQKEDILHEKIQSYNYKYNELKSQLIVMESMINMYVNVVLKEYTIKKLFDNENQLFNTESIQTKRELEEMWKNFVTNHITTSSFFYNQVKKHKKFVEIVKHFNNYYKEYNNKNEHKRIVHCWKAGYYKHGGIMVSSSSSSMDTESSPQQEIKTIETHCFLSDTALQDNERIKFIYQHQFVKHTDVSIIPETSSQKLLIIKESMWNIYDILYTSFNNVFMWTEQLIEQLYNFTQTSKFTTTTSSSHASIPIVPYHIDQSSKNELGIFTNTIQQLIDQFVDSSQKRTTPITLLSGIDQIITNNETKSYINTKELYDLLFHSIMSEKPNIERLNNLTILLPSQKNPPSTSLEHLNLLFSSICLMNIKIVAVFCQRFFSSN